MLADNGTNFVCILCYIIVFYGIQYARKKLLGKGETEEGLQLERVNDSGIQYARKKLLGKGGNGRVCLGFFDGAKVAVKIILIDPELSETRRETQLQKRLEHKNVVKIFAIESDRNFTYLALELCIGTLMNIIENNYKGPALPSKEMMMYQIANGLDYIHSQGLVHRDIKPPNILISPSGTMKISDFGDSKEIDCNGCYSYSGFRGTVPWMAPEVIHFFNQHSRKNSVTTLDDKINIFTTNSDVFSTGCVFFFLLKGKHPFEDKFCFVGRNILKHKPVNISCLKDTDLTASTIKSMLAINPENRANSKAIKEELKQIVRVQ